MTIKPLEWVTIFGDNKASEHANLIFVEPWVMTNKIMLNAKL